MGGKKPWDERRIALQPLLRQMREEAGLLQAELGAKLNADQSFVSRYERGERRLDLIELADICAACGWPLSDLVARLQLKGPTTEGRAKGKRRG
ncbi:MAG TPA: helix-turn-helix transcriptional regulator [Verrucomicrobiae bacterium]|nr:helix-turn-helix transcriptional regulator [Verrucomicrobiae bacterium]